MENSAINMTVATYSFEVWDAKRNSLLVGTDIDFGSSKAQVALRLPPQSLTIERTYRADLGVDLAGNAVVTEAGFGPGRWSLRGSHGVGPNGLRADGLKVPTQGDASGAPGQATTAGFGTRIDVQNLFLAYASANRKRAANGDPLHRMVFSVRGGPPSEFQNEEWWVLPMGLPTDDRSSGRPHDWSYAITFWALDRVRGEEAPVARNLKADMDAISARNARLTILANMLDISKNPVAKTIRAFLTTTAQVTYAAQQARSRLTKDIKFALGAIDQATAQIGVLNSALNQSTLRADLRSQVRDSLAELRAQFGLLKIQIRADLPTIGGRVIVPSPIPVIPGQDLRAIAAFLGGDANTWADMANSNGLVYPWISWPDSNGNSPARSLTPGSVASPGMTVAVPGGAGNLAVDPVGADLDPGGAVDVNGRAVLVGGAANLKSALTRRLLTPKGYLPQHPSYGSSLGDFVGAPLNVPTLLSIRAEVARTLMADPRVSSVKSVTVDASSTTGTLTVTASVVTVAGVLSLSATPMSA